MTAFNSENFTKLFRGEQMKVIGITGGVGCGKTTIINLIKEHLNHKKNVKFTILMTDEISRNLLQPEQKAYVQVVELFGESIVNEDKTIHRGKLAEIIFKNPNKRIVLNSIIHPLVKQEVINIINSRRIEEYDYVFIESALLYDDHYEVFCDETWYIYAPKEQRIQRLKVSRSYSQDKIESIMKSQLTEQQFRNQCDVVIDNDKTCDDVRQQLVKLL